jgi:predicted hydrolase (HD superfamily)
MSFYLLKSTYRRDATQDYIINLDKIISCQARKHSEDEEIFFMIVFLMENDEKAIVKFNTEEELRKEILNIFQDQGISCGFQIIDKTSPAIKENFKNKLKEMFDKRLDDLI